LFDVPLDPPPVCMHLVVNNLNCFLLTFLKIKANAIIEVHTKEHYIFFPNMFNLYQHSDFYQNVYELSTPLKTAFFAGI